MTVERPVREWNGLVIPDPGVYTLDEAHKRIGFVAQHMMVSPIRGEFAKGAGKPAVSRARRPPGRWRASPCVRR